MQSEPEISALAHSIQLALTPVFLLTGVAGFLNVLANRLARIVDRTRWLEENPGLAGSEIAARNATELQILWRRRHLIHRAITLCTYSATLVAAVVAAIFFAATGRFNIAILVMIGFVAAMFALVAGLLSFLREVHLAARYVRGVMPRVDLGP